MRKETFVGLALAAAAFVAMLISGALDLELEPVMILGVAVGAVVGLVPDGAALMRLAGFVGGFVIGMVGYFLRAAILPDVTAGRAVMVAVVILLCLGLTLALMGRIPLWSSLLGAGAFAGAYEYTYDQAPPEIATTSISTATVLLVCAAIGFLAAAAFGPEHEHEEEREHAESQRDTEDHVDLTKSSARTGGKGTTRTSNKTAKSDSDTGAFDSMMGK